MIRRELMAGVATILCAVGCGSSASPSSSSETTATVSGALTMTSTTGVRAIAKTSANKMIWVAVDTNGRFSLPLPKGESYRLLIGKLGASGNVAIVGHLALNTSAGKNLWLAPSTDVDLGTLTPVSGTSSALKLAHADGDAEESEAADDNENEGTEANEEDDDGSMCKGSAASGESDVELKAEKDPGDSACDHEREKSDSDKDGKRDSEDGDDEKSCGSDGKPEAEDDADGSDDTGKVENEADGGL